MKKVNTFLFLLVSGIISYTQAPEIEWQNTIGGDLGDNFTVLQSLDGGYYVGGASNSGNSGDKTEPGFGASDYWILKIDSIGNIQWQRTIGGSSLDDLFSLAITHDNGVILAGSSLSDSSGNKNESSIASSFDYWVVKLDSVGNIEWQNNIGGSGNDQLYCIEQTTDKGYILGGFSNSPISGDKTEANLLGSDDYWVVKLDSVGNIEWQNNIGGSGQDWLYFIVQTPEGGYILCGRSSSGLSGDKNEANIAGSTDYWVIKLNTSGEIEWQNTIGGNLDDWPHCIQPTSDGGYIIGGLSNSGTSGDKTESSLGSYDYWIVKINSLGEIQWQNTIGGNLSDILYSLEQTVDDGFILGGISSSGISGDKTENNIGFQDYWVIKLDNIGNIIWQKSLGGWSEDILKNIKQTDDQGYILGGHSDSPISGDKTENNFGYNDFWIIKLYPDSCESTIFYADYDRDGFGNHIDSVSACFAPFGYIGNNTDCDDIDSLVNPGVTEICNFLDDNCNFLIDEDLPPYVYFSDMDSDGYGDSLSSIITCFDTPPAGYVIDNSDCDDDDNSIHEAVVYYADFDGDSFGDIFNAQEFCFLTPPPNFTSDSTDCDDTNAQIYPGAIEMENGLDDNCNSYIDEGFNGLYLFSQNTVEIYPNPNNGNFVIKYPPQFSSEIIIELFNLNGEKLVYERFNNSNISYITLPNFYSGVALVLIKFENNRIFKLIDIVD